MGDREVVIRRAEPRDMPSVVEMWLKFSEERAAGNERYALGPDAGSLWAGWA